MSDDLNVAIVRGRLSRPAEERILPANGGRLVGLDLVVRREAGRADSVPVVWPDGPASAAALQEGDEVVVVGHVARRFFRAGGSTQSRTEIVAHKIVPVTSKRKASDLIADAVAELASAVRP